MVTPEAASIAPLRALAACFTPEAACRLLCEAVAASKSADPCTRSVLAIVLAGLDARGLLAEPRRFPAPFLCLALDNPRTFEDLCSAGLRPDGLVASHACALLAEWLRDPKERSAALAAWPAGAKLVAAAKASSAPAAASAAASALGSRSPTLPPSLADELWDGLKSISETS